MVMRVASGMARYRFAGLGAGDCALPGVAGSRGPRPRHRPIAGERQPHRQASARSAEGGPSVSRHGRATTGEANGTLALITGTPGCRAVQWLYLIDTKNRAFAIYRIDPTNPQGDRQARGLASVRVGPQAGTVQQPGARARRDQGDGARLWLVRPQ